MRHILMAALCALALLPRAAHAACQVTSGSLALTKIRLGDPGNVWVDCVNRSFDVLSASVPVSGTSTPSLFGPIYTPEIGGRATGTFGIKFSSPIYTLSGGPYLVWRTSASFDGPTGLDVLYGLDAGSVTAQGVTASSGNITGANGLTVAYGVVAGTVVAQGVTASSGNITGANGLTVAYGVVAGTVAAQGVTASSANVTGANGLAVRYGVVAGTFTASSMTLNGAGGATNAFNLVVSTGIKVSAGYLEVDAIRWSRDGSISTQAVSGGGGGGSSTCGYVPNKSSTTANIPGTTGTNNSIVGAYWNGSSVTVLSATAGNYIEICGSFSMARNNNNGSKVGIGVQIDFGSSTEQVGRGATTTSPFWFGRGDGNSVLFKTFFSGCWTHPTAIPSSGDVTVGLHPMIDATDTWTIYGGDDWKNWLRIRETTCAT